MAGQILNRGGLRKQAEQTEAVAPATALAAVTSEKKAKAKAPASPKANKPRKPKTPPHLPVREGVLDNNQRAAAEEKLADLLAKEKGIQFLQIVKEPMPRWAPSVE
jgi:type IV secretory pathway VirB10-like protein